MTQEEILKLAETHLYNADGGYVFDYGKEYILDFGRALVNATLEEAAVVCETAPDCIQDSTFSGAARAIRALKDPK